MLAEIMPVAWVDAHHEFLGDIERLTGKGLTAEEWEEEVHWRLRHLHRQLEKIQAELKSSRLTVGR